MLQRSQSKADILYVTNDNFEKSQINKQNLGSFQAKVGVKLNETFLVFLLGIDNTCRSMQKHYKLPDFPINDIQNRIKLYRHVIDPK